MGVNKFFAKIKQFIKKKSPATFNAAEYETQRVLNRIGESEKITAQIQEKTDRMERQLNAVCQQFSALSEQLASVNTTAQQHFSAFGREAHRYFDVVAELKNDISDVREEMLSNNAAASELKAGLSEMRQEMLDQNAVSKNKDAEILRIVGELKQAVYRCDLNGIASCKSDNDFDKRLIPLNRYFDNRGMAVAMHLTSVAEKPDPIVYETADVIRTSTLSLIADEIHARELKGAVAELGVAQGKFARVINALFPEKELHLFDTFEGFPKSDIADDKQRNFSDTKSEWYADIDMSALMSSMRYPERCIIHRGYFPDTAVGMEEERFCFVSIDCDLYKPILAGLEFFYPRLVKGGYIFVHDYRSKYFTGVRAALNEFAQKNNISYCVIPDNTGTAVITK